MRETGKVVKVLDKGKVEVEMASTSGCAKCGLCKIGMNNKAYLIAVANKDLSVGDRVEVEMKEKEVVWITFLIFILPLILFFAGYLTYNYLLAIALLSAYYFGLWLYDKDAHKKGKHLPLVTRKV